MKDEDEVSGRGIGRETLASYLASVLSGRVEVLAVRPREGAEARMLDAEPRDLDGERVRALARFLAYPGVSEGPTSVEVVLDYEPSLRPELTIYTDVQDCMTAVDEVLFVAERLRRYSVDREGSPPCE